MATLWTPEGEHRVPRPGTEEPSEPPGALSDPGEFGPPESEMDEETLAAAREEIAELERELLAAPVEAVIANHCYGIFQLAALHLSQQPPHLEDARLAIDAFAAVLEALGDRFGPNTATMREALSQIRLAYVQISTGQPPGGSTDDGAVPEGVSP